MLIAVILRLIPNLIPLIKGVDLLYHESTFLEKHSELAKITKHSTLPHFKQQ